MHEIFGLKHVFSLLKKLYGATLRPLYFAQTCPQNAGNAVSETQKRAGGAMSLDPNKCVVKVVV